MNQWHLIQSASWDSCTPEDDSSGRWLHLILDADSSANVLKPDVLEGLSQRIIEVGKYSNVDALIISSAKDKHFIAGADVNSIGTAESIDQVKGLCRDAQDLFGRLGRLHIPSISVIRGTCLGGGLELSLGCNMRIAVDDPSTKIGFPEVNLGIIPGFGGTVRTAQLLGLRGALQWILTARRLPARIAAKKGIVDAVIPAEGFRGLALKLIEDALADNFENVLMRRKKFRKGFTNFLLDETPPGRFLTSRIALKSVREKTKGKMPAPEAAIAVARYAAASSTKDSLEEEAREAAKLAVGPVCRNLVSIFQDSERARRGTPTDPEGTWNMDQNLVVLGAGVMGAGVATVAIEKGLKVRLRDISQNSLDAGLSRIGKAIDKKKKKKRITQYQQADILARLGYGTELSGLGQCSGVLEAVVERLDVKKSVLADIAPHLAQDAIFATNTSALSVTDIQEDSSIAERVVGLHFFNPVPLMPLVEIIPGRFTSPDTVGKALALARSLGKYPVIVKDSPGFLVNRLLCPYLDAASCLLQKGVSGLTIDKVARSYGLPMGPFRLMDEVGLDVGQEVQETLQAAFGDRASASDLLPNMVSRGWLGKKSGTGFYLHSSKRAVWNQAMNEVVQGKNSYLQPDEIIHELLDPMIDEAARCLEEGVVSDPGYLDLAMVFGTGFPPHLGGPLRAADAQGVSAIRDRIKLTHELGGSRLPCSLLEDLATRNSGFYSLGLPTN